MSSQPLIGCHVLSLIIMSFHWLPCHACRLIARHMLSLVNKSSQGSEWLTDNIFRNVSDKQTWVECRVAIATKNRESDI